MRHFQIDYSGKLKRFAKNLTRRFGAKCPEPIDVVGVSKSTCASSFFRNALVKLGGTRGLGEGVRTTAAGTDPRLSPKFGAIRDHLEVSS